MKTHKLKDGLPIVEGDEIEVPIRFLIRFR
jgi:hypothetical protein